MGGTGLRRFLASVLSVGAVVGFSVWAVAMYQGAQPPVADFARGRVVMKGYEEPVDVQVTITGDFEMEFAFSNVDGVTAQLELSGFGPVSVEGDFGGFAVTRLIDDPRADLSVWGVTNALIADEGVMTVTTTTPLRRSGAGVLIVAYPELFWGDVGAPFDQDDVAVFGGDPGKLEVGDAGFVEDNEGRYDRREPAWPATSCQFTASVECAPTSGIYRYASDAGRRAADRRILWSGVLFGLAGNAAVGLAAAGVKALWGSGGRRPDPPPIAA